MRIMEKARTIFKVAGVLILLFSYGNNVRQYTASPDKDHLNKL